MRLKSVVLPAPLGPMMALTEPRGTEKLTPPTAWKPSKLLRSSRTSSTRGPSPEPPPEAEGGAGNSPGKDEEKHDENGAEDEGPVLRVRDDLLVEPEEHESSQGRPEEGAHAPQERHDQHLGGLGPVGEVREDSSIEDAEEPAGQAGEGARDHEGAEFVASHVDADELRALRVLTDGREHAPEGRPHDAAEEPQAAADHEQGEKVEILRGSVAAEQGHHARPSLEPREIRVGDLRHALLPARDLVPLEADGPDDLREGQREHGEVDAREPHAEEAEHDSKEAGEEPGGGEGEKKRHSGLLHEEPGRVGADAEIGGVAERHQPGVADKEIEAGGEERPDHDVIGEEGVVARAERGDEEGGDQHEDGPARTQSFHKGVISGVARAGPRG